MFFDGALIVGVCRAVLRGRKSYLGQLKSHVFPAGILAEAISMTHSDMLHRLDISPFYFYEPLLFQILVPWKFMNILGLPLSTLTFTVNSHVDNHSYKYIYLLQILYTMKSVFLLKYRLRFRPRFFILKFDLITYCTHMMSYAIWIDETADVLVSLKKINKN